MTTQAANKILQMLRDHWDMFIGDATAQLWLAYLAGQDAELVTRSVLHLAERRQEAPKISDLAEVVTMLSRDQRRALPKARCETCGDDRFVLYSRRPAKASAWMLKKGIAPPEGVQHDEMAPCPDCNANCDVSFQRYDGTWFNGPDPALVRERMRK